jgi:hypothetical protein
MWKSNFSLNLSIDLNFRHTSKKIKGGSPRKILEKKKVFPKKYVELRTFDGSNYTYCWCGRYRWCTLICNYLQKISKNSKWPCCYFQGLGEDDSWKNLKQKISWHCPFKLFCLYIFFEVFCLKFFWSSFLKPQPLHLPSSIKFCFLVTQINCCEKFLYGHYSFIRKLRIHRGKKEKK